MKLWTLLFVVTFFSIVSCNRKDVRIPAPEPEVEVVVEEVVPVRKVDPTRLRIGYLGNMGVLIQSQDRTVIIDGFHKEYKPEYTFPSELMVTQLIDGAYPFFDQIEVALVTHNHPDHFDPEYLDVFLRDNPKALAIGSQQVRDAILEEAKDGQKPLDYRIERVPYDNDQYLFFHEDIEIKGVRCDHAEGEHVEKSENIAYFIILNDYKIVHLGDSHWFEGFSGMSDFRLREEKIDVVIMPYWMLLDPNSFAENKSLIGAKQIIATHIPPDLSDDDREKILIAHGNVTLFTELGQEFEY